MWSFVVSNDEYLDKYHEVYKEFLNSCLLNGDVTNEINRINELIRDDVKNDPSSYYSIEEYDEGVIDLINFIDERTASISNQLK